MADLKIEYPVAIDNEYGIWREFGNEYWPAHYFIDAQGKMRHRYFGEGQYDVSERVIQQLLKEAGNTKPAVGLVSVTAAGAQAPPSTNQVRSPETYLGYNRIENFASPGGLAQDKTKSYAAASAPRLNQWSLTGDWTVTGESASLDTAGGRIIFRFRARDVHLVLGPAKDETKVRFRVTIDGKPPGADAGTDVDANGQGVVDSQRLYQLVRQKREILDRTFEIEFLDPGVQAYAFTFG